MLVTARRALVAGGTGAVGHALLHRLAASPAAWRVVAWGRRPTGVAGVIDHPIAADGDDALPVSDVAFCALGTTRKKAGSADAFRAVDETLVLRFADAARRAGCRTFILVSSAGADARSPALYLRVKGTVEAALAGMCGGPEGFERVIVVRPSLLLAPRPDRPGEAAVVWLARVLAPALRWIPARPIEVDAVAAAMLALDQTAPAGFSVHENAALHAPD